MPVFRSDVGISVTPCFSFKGSSFYHRTEKICNNHASVFSAIDCGANTGKSVSRIWIDVGDVFQSTNLIEYTTCSVCKCDTGRICFVVHIKKAIGNSAGSTMSSRCKSASSAVSESPGFITRYVGDWLVDTGKQVPFQQKYALCPAAVSTMTRLTLTNIVLANVCDAGCTCHEHVCRPLYVYTESDVTCNDWANEPKLMSRKMLRLRVRVFSFDGIDFYEIKRKNLNLPFDRKIQIRLYFIQLQVSSFV